MLAAPGPPPGFAVAPGGCPASGRAPAPRPRPRTRRSAFRPARKREPPPPTAARRPRRPRRLEPRPGEFSVRPAGGLHGTHPPPDGEPVVCSFAATSCLRRRHPHHCLPRGCRDRLFVGGGDQHLPAILQAPHQPLPPAPGGPP